MLELKVDDFMTLFLVMLFLLLVLTMLDSSRRRRRFRLELPRIKTELKCVNCGLKEVRDFREGDYISKYTGEKCKKCGGNLQIFLIYSVLPREVS
jgi:DNA-directed RNA polymerase subunit RPC12/RpoP